MGNAYRGTLPLPKLEKMHDSGTVHAVSFNSRKVSIIQNHSIISKYTTLVKEDSDIAPARKQFGFPFCPKRQRNLAHFREFMPIPILHVNLK